MKIISPLVSVMFLCSVLFACRQSGSSHTEGLTGDSAVAKAHYSFFKTYPTEAGDTPYTDSTVLQLTVDGGTAVSGTYRWVIPGKDGKYGTITGRLSNDTIYGRYIYRQEGGNYNDSVRIVLHEGSAVVTQFSPDNYQLTDTLR